MTYKEISKLTDELHGKDPYIVVKILIVAAVDDNLTTSDYNDKEYEKTCQRLFDFAHEKGFEVDFDELVCQIENLIEDGDFDEPSWECIEQAYEYMAG